MATCLVDVLPAAVKQGKVFLANGELTLAHDALH